ncbi:MAG: phosphatidate cytidylyltransferase [Acidimicrobiales bacterium]
MDEYDDELDDELDDDGPRDEVRPRARPSRGEGVRIIGAEEAAKALADGQAGGRRPAGAPRFGDVPSRPQGRPVVQRFPLPETAAVDPASAVRRPPPARSPEMPHWTEPPSGEVPRVLADDIDDLEVWAALPNRGPRWRDSGSDWDDDPNFDPVADLAGDGDGDLRIGALDDRRAERSDLFSFEDSFEDSVEGSGAPAAQRPVTTSIRTRRPPAETGSGGPPAAPRDMGQAVAFGVAMLVVALLAFKAGPLATLVLVTTVVAVAVAEAYDALRQAGYRPATLLGITASVSIMLAVYNEGQSAIALVLVLTTLFTFLWYLFRVVQAQPLLNIAATLLPFLWVGVSGSFAALLITIPERRGIAFLLAAVIATAAYDVGGMFFGRQMGSRPLAPDISPNKTVEGLVGGMATAVFVTAVVIGVFPGIAPWSFGKALVLGLTVAVVAPLGDLCQSMLKRDLAIKDMGSILPGHGGVLDRFDALLFVLPATYYLVQFLELA